MKALPPPFLGLLIAALGCQPSKDQLPPPQISVRCSADPADELSEPPSGLHVRRGANVSCRVVMNYLPQEAFTFFGTSATFELVAVGTGSTEYPVAIQWSDQLQHGARAGDPPDRYYARTAGDWDKRGDGMASFTFDTEDVYTVIVRQRAGTVIAFTESSPGSSRDRVIVGALPDGGVPSDDAGSGADGGAPIDAGPRDGAIEDTGETADGGPPSCTVRDVSSGGHICAVRSDGAVFCWGRNANGELGDGTTMDRPLPTRVSLLTDVEEVGSGATFSCARKRDGTVWCWGDNSSGQLGIGNTTSQTAPTEVSSLGGITRISVGAMHACAIRATDRALFCWGRNFGALGDGTETQRNAPVTITGAGAVSEVSAGERHTCAVLMDRTLRCWGDHGLGQLGTGPISATPTTIPTPVLVAPNSDFSIVSAGQSATCATKTDGSLWCWGTGPIGDGELLDPREPVRIRASDTVRVSVGNGVAAATTAGGAVFSWGTSAFGALGLGSTQPTTDVPLPLSALTSGVGALSVGNERSCALSLSGILECWGSSPTGNGSTGSRFLPEVITVPCF